MFPYSSEGTGRSTIGSLAMGVVLLVFGGFNEALTKRVAVLPPRLFKVSFQFEVGMPS